MISYQNIELKSIFYIHQISFSLIPLISQFICFIQLIVSTKLLIFFILISLLFLLLLNRRMIQFSPKYFTPWDIDQTNLQTNTIINIPNPKSQIHLANSRHRKSLQLNILKQTLLKTQQAKIIKKQRFSIEYQRNKRFIKTNNYLFARGSMPIFKKKQIFRMPKKMIPQFERNTFYVLPVTNNEQYIGYNEQYKVQKLNICGSNNHSRLRRSVLNEDDKYIKERISKMYKQNNVYKNLRIRDYNNHR